MWPNQLCRTAAWTGVPCLQKNRYHENTVCFGRNSGQDYAAADIENVVEDRKDCARCRRHEEYSRRIEVVQDLDGES